MKSTEEFFATKGFERSWISPGIVVWERVGEQRHIHVSNVNDAQWDKYPEASAPCLVIMYGNNHSGQQDYVLGVDSPNLGQEALEMLLDGLITKLDTPWINGV